MKSSPAARRTVKIRAIMAGAALVAIFGFELAVGLSLAARVGQTNVRQTEVTQVSNVGMADCFVGLR